MDKKIKTGHNFATFSGVFLPSILTIFGLIMFMRTGYVVGKAGVIASSLILFISISITFSTALSISAISSNTKVAGGGVYFLISRSLGLEFGGAIGVTLFFAQTLSIPFYILGFSESLINSFPMFKEYYLLISLLLGVLLFILVLVGADWAVKIQFLIFIILTFAILSFMFGAGVNFKMEVLKENLYVQKTTNICMIFAVFFPAVTGIMAGVNMSGDLKDPSKSIPKGSLLALLLAAVVYFIQIVLSAGAFSQNDLVSKPYMILVENAIFGTGFLVIAGVFAATISSAIGSYLGSPRILQALAIDNIYNILDVFKKGEGTHNEPRRGLILTFVITIAVLLWAGSAGLNESGMSPALNAVSAIVTMFFLYTYGMVNLAAFVESFGDNPSFRPKFKFFHWSVALFGLISCLISSFLINYIASILAIIIISALFWRAKSKLLRQTFGDARRGFLYSRIRENLLKLNKMPIDSKNWRPTIAVLTGNPQTRLALLEYAVRFESDKGIVSLIEIIIGDVKRLKSIKLAGEERLKKFIEVNELEVFSEVIISNNFDNALTNFLQIYSIGPIKPNIIMLGWANDSTRYVPFIKHINMILNLEKSCILLVNKKLEPCPEPPISGDIDIWWRGMKNGALMLILAYLLKSNKYWRNTNIRIIRTIRNKNGLKAAEKALKTLINSARISAEARIVVSNDAFDCVLSQESKKSTLVFMGFLPAKSGEEDLFFDNYNKMLKDMPTTFLISSAGDADIQS